MDEIIINADTNFQTIGLSTTQSFEIVHWPINVMHLNRSVVIRLNWNNYSSAKRLYMTRVDKQCLQSIVPKKQWRSVFYNAFCFPQEQQEEQDSFIQHEPFQSFSFCKTYFTDCCFRFMLIFVTTRLSFTKHTFYSFSSSPSLSDSSLLWCPFDVGTPSGWSLRNLRTTSISL